MLFLLACVQNLPDPANNGDGTTALPAPELRPPGYGFWGLNGYTSHAGFLDVEQRFNATVFQVACSDPHWCVNHLLPMVQGAKMKVTFRLTADHEAYTNTQGDFVLASWKDQLKPWIDSGVQAYIENGTLIGHMILDDISNFEGRDPDAADLEEMARYSKELFPGLMTYVRQKASQMPVPESGGYVYVDAIVNQYTAAEGTVQQYAALESRRAQALNLGIINGLNIADGGDGSSGRPGYRVHKFAMSAAEITAYGSVLATVPGCGMFLNWEYDAEEHWYDGSIGADYFNQPELQDALASLGALVGSQAPVRLLKTP